MRVSRIVIAAALLVGTGLVCPVALAAEPPSQIITFNDDGAWSWFEDERAILHDGKLIIGSVAAGAHDAGRRGDVEVLTYDIASGSTTLSELHHDFQYDDHNSPALLVLPGGRILAVYAKHGLENRFYFRVSAHPNDAAHWGPEQVFVPSETSRITYSNLHRLSSENNGKGRIYDFYRGLDGRNKPSYAYSDDGAATWISGNVFLDVPSEFRHRPYVKYASNGVDTVHMFYTEGHPRDFDNSAYHIYYRGGDLHQSDGTVIGSLQEGLAAPDQGTRILQGDAGNVAWVSDLHLDREGNPYVPYSVQKDSAGLPPGQGGEDHRYRYARWRDGEWFDHEIAYAGSRLYAGEDDYTGNLALDPDDPNTVFISTDADPLSGEPLVSAADQRRHYEIFQGVTGDGGASWRWRALTADSTSDNLRPVVPNSDGRRRAVLWLRGRYSAYTDYDLDVVGVVTAAAGAK